MSRRGLAAPSLLMHGVQNAVSHGCGKGEIHNLHSSHGEGPAPAAVGRAAWMAEAGCTAACWCPGSVETGWGQGSLLMVGLHRAVSN